MKFAEDIRATVRVGLVSVSANLVPMIVLWVLAAVLVLCGVVPGVFLLSVGSIRPQMPIAAAFAQGVRGGVAGIVYDFLLWDRQSRITLVAASDFMVK